MFRLRLTGTTVGPYVTGSEYFYGRDLDQVVDTDSECLPGQKCRTRTGCESGLLGKMDGTYWLLTGNLEEGLRHDADFTGQVRVHFPKDWIRG